jgi:hypothetical protein
MRHTIALSAILAAAVSAFGAAPVARVISNDAIEVDGITAPARNFMPVSLGGEITTHGAPATIQFPDGTSVSIQPNSQLRVDGLAGHPEVRMIRGAAQFNLKTSAAARAVAGARYAANKVADSATLQASAMSSPTSPVSEALMARATSGGAVQITPVSPIMTGGFTSGAALTGVFKISVGGGGPSILLPSGLTMNLTPSTTIVNGVSTTTYTIASITQTVSVTETVSTPSTTPGQPPVISTVTVQQTVTTPPPASLAAAVITVSAPATSGANAGQSSIVVNTATVNPNTGVTTLAPIAPATVASNINTTVATAAQTQATATPPAGSTVTAATATVTTTAVTTGAFSPNAP